MQSALRQNLAEYTTIKEASAYLGVNASTLRNWEKAGKLKPMRHPMNGYRIYWHEDLEAILQASDSSHQMDNVAPSVDWMEMAESRHFVQFYESHAVLVDSVSEFIAMALEKGEGGGVIATPTHHRGIEKKLQARGIDVSNAIKRGQYVCLDAAETLAKFMAGGMPDPQRFNQVVGEIIAKITKNYGHLRAFDEMVAILWEAGNRQAAIRLEELWNELGKTHSFSLYCAYPLKTFADVNDREDFSSVCSCHSAVIPAETYAALITPGQRLRAISQLQQKASSLEAEIDHRKEVEKSLLKRERELADFFENAAEGIHKVDTDGIIIDANKAELALLGYEAGEYIGHHIAEFHADRDVIEDILCRLQAGETLRDYEARLRCKHGSIKHVLISSNIYQEDGKILYTRCFTRDITERKLAEKAQALLAAVVESSQDAILSKTLEGYILSWNTGAERLFGYTAEEIIGQPITIIIPPDRREEETYILKRLKRGERIEHYETVRMTKDGRLIDISLTISPVRDSHGRIVGASKVARDITEKKRIEKELQDALEKARAASIAKTEFLTNMSHEIRTPMNAVIGLANILGISQPLTPKQREFIKTLQLSADSLLSLINDLLDISKIEARTIELENIPFCLTRMTQEVISMMSLRMKEKGLTLTTDAEYARHHMFIGDPTRLRQIILNLCSNAVKFTERGGIHISIACEPTAQPDTETVRIAVKDTGIGIPPDKREEIFQKFVQADTSISRKYGGTGLGLTITKTLVEIMGGTIEVESRLAEGSTFTVCLPLRIAKDVPLETAETETAGITLPKDADQPRVLLVEDYAANILVATTFLDHFGYAYDLAKNGREAVEKARTGNYVAVLMDVQMYGMNGFEATRLIREYEKQAGKPRMLIIGMTAHALAGDRERCLSTGMDDYISKPFNHETLRKKLACARETIPEAA